MRYNEGVMRIGITYSASVPAEVQDALCGRIRALGGTCTLFPDAEKIRDVDRLIVLGGDGTVLHAARCVSRARIPLVGVNFGRIGFLTEFEREEAERAADLAMNENCQTLVRAMIEVEFHGAKTDCLNEVALLRGVSPDLPNRIEKIAVRIDGSSAGEFFADGLIVATPTGSTAYSLSAGGCIMTPDCRTILLTPVCAFSLRSRPITCPDSSALTVSVAEGDALLAYGDGIFLGKLGAGESLTVRRSERSAGFLTRDRHEFFRRLTEKIN